MGSVVGFRPPAAQRSPEIKPENPRIPPVQEKEVLLFEWWLMKAEKSYNGRSLTVGGFTSRGEAVRIFRSAPIIKRHNNFTLETADGITLRIQGAINKTRTIDNGFSLEASNAFLFGFSKTWDNFTKDSCGNNSSEDTFEPSLQDKTVLLRNWWLRKAEMGSDGNRLAVGGFTECGKATRLFYSSPIIKRHDAYTLETADGITIRIEGFINKIRTLDNGFPLEACKTFLIGFPTTWTDFANGSSWDKSSHADIPVSASWSAEWSKDSRDNEPFGFPVKSDNKILDNVPATSNTSVCDSGTKFGEEICKFTALLSMLNPAHINNQLQGDESCGAILRDSNAGYNAYQAGHTPVCIHSENHESSSIEGAHTEGAGCLTGDLHVDGLSLDKSLKHQKMKFIEDAVLSSCKKCNGRAVTKGHNDEVVGTSSTNNLQNSVVEKDYQKEETHWKNNEKFIECSTRRLEKVRPSLSKGKYLLREDQNYAKYKAKPVRRSVRLKLLSPENVHGEFPDNSQFLDDDFIVGQFEETPANSKAVTSRTAEKVRPSLSKGKYLLREDQNYVKYKAKPVRRSMRLKLLNPENVHGEFPDNSQFLNDDFIVGQFEETPANSKAVTSRTAEKRTLKCSRKKKDIHTAKSTIKVGQNDSRNQSSGTSFEEKISFSSSSYSRKASHAKNVKVSTETQHAEDKASHKSGYRTLRVSSYTDGLFGSLKKRFTALQTQVHCTPLARSLNDKQTILTPESLNLRRSRSGRLLIPTLDPSMRAMYEPDGSFVGTAAVDGSWPGTARVVMSTSQSKGNGKTLGRKRPKKQP